MRHLFAAFLVFASQLLHSDPDTFSRARLEAFYLEFLTEERDLLAAGGISSNPYSPPPTPPAPVYKTGLLPIVLVNNSGQPDSSVYVLFTGKNYDSPAAQVWGSVNTTPGASYGVMTLVPVTTSSTSLTYSYKLSELPQTSSGGRVVYVPQMQSGLVWFSIDTALTMTVIDSSGTNTIVQPNFMNTSDVNYYTNFDIFEFTRDTTDTVYADATAVSFFSIPLYGYLSGVTSQSSTTGLYQARSYIMSKVASTFNTITQPTTQSQWNKLFLKNGNTILRLASTGKAISASLFDSNYLDDLAAYGFSYIQDIWSGGTSSFYAQNHLSMVVEVTSPSTATYHYAGHVNGSNQFVFVSTDSGPTVTFPAPVTTGGVTNTTTYDIFAALNLVDPVNQPTAGTADDAVSKLFEEALIAGLLPTTNTVSLSYLSSNQSSYYTVNPNLPTTGQNTGPWYDMYSRALHALGSIYTYGFDEPLWPQVLLKAPFVENSTYLSITIGSL